MSTFGQKRNKKWLMTKHMHRQTILYVYRSYGILREASALEWIQLLGKSILPLKNNHSKEFHNSSVLQYNMARFKTRKRLMEMAGWLLFKLLFLDERLLLQLGPK